MEIDKLDLLGHFGSALFVVGLFTNNTFIQIGAGLCWLTWSVCKMSGVE